MQDPVFVETRMILEIWSMHTENSTSKRLEIYRRKRIRRKVSFAALIIVGFLLIAGIVIVDISVNRLVSGKQTLSLIDVKNHVTHVEITVMNHRIRIDTEYLSKDIEALKDLIQGTALKNREDS